MTTITIMETSLTEIIQEKGGRICCVDPQATILEAAKLMKEDGRNPLDLTDEELETRFRDAWQSTVGNSRPDVQANLLSIEMNKRFLRDSTKRNEKLINQNHMEHFLIHI